MSESGFVQSSGVPDAFSARPPREPLKSNGLLSALSPDTFDRLKPHLREHFFRDGHVLIERGDCSDRIYFPLSGMISLVLGPEPGTFFEVSSVGIEGAVGFGGDVDAPPTFASAIVRISGSFADISRPDFNAAKQASDELHRLEVVCQKWLLTQAQQNAVCNAFHAGDARFARWLVRAAEATGSHIVPVTQEVVAEMLGLRRSTVTLIARNLQTSGLIQYRRGIIAILDYDGLRAVACSCCDLLGSRHWPSEFLKLTSSPGAEGQH